MRNKLVASAVVVLSTALSCLAGQINIIPPKAVKPAELAAYSNYVAATYANVVTNLGNFNLGTNKVITAVAGSSYGLRYFGTNVIGVVNTVPGFRWSDASAGHDDWLAQAEGDNWILQQMVGDTTRTNRMSYDYATTSWDLHGNELKNVILADSAGSLEFYFRSTTATNPASGYKLMLEGSPANPKVTNTYATVTNNQVLVSYVSDYGGIGVTTLRKGTWAVHAHAKRTAGHVNRTLALKAKLYLMNPAGTRTQLGTDSEQSLTLASGVDWDDDLHGFIVSDVVTTAVTRLSVDLIAVVGGSGTPTPTVEKYIQGSTDSHLMVGTTAGSVYQAAKTYTDAKIALIPKYADFAGRCPTSSVDTIQAFGFRPTQRRYQRFVGKVTYGTGTCTVWIVSSPTNSMALTTNGSFILSPTGVSGTTWTAQTNAANRWAGWKVGQRAATVTNISWSLNWLEP